jgi:hypothetical protein
MSIASAFGDPTGLAAALTLAADAPAGPPASVAVQVALIGALAPIFLVVVNELFKRWRAKPDEPRDSLLAPVEEVPRDQYDKLLEVVADQADQIISLQQALATNQMRFEEERRVAQREKDIERERYEEEGDQLRERLAGEIERRARAEARAELLEQRRRD